MKPHYLSFGIPDFNADLIKVAFAEEIEDSEHLTNAVHIYVAKAVDYAMFRTGDIRQAHADFVEFMRDNYAPLAYRTLASREVLAIDTNTSALAVLYSQIVPHLGLDFYHVALESYIMKTLDKLATECFGSIIDNQLHDYILHTFTEAMRKLTFSVDVRYIKNWDGLYGHEYRFERKGCPDIRVLCSHDYSQAELHVAFDYLDRDRLGATWCIPGVDFWMPRSVCVGAD